LVDQLQLFAERRRLTVLVVDDDRGATAVIRRRLESHSSPYTVLEMTPRVLVDRGLPDDQQVDVVVVGVTSDPESMAPLRWLTRHADLAVVAIHHGDGLEDSLDRVVTGAQDVLPFADATSPRLDRVIRSAIARKRAEVAALASARSDPVTGMPSRAWMLERIEMSVAHAATCADGWQVALLFCDLDRFKAVNDSLGHSKGDELLRLVGERLRSVVRADDAVTRFGGDEFVILLEGHRIEALAHRIAARALGVLTGPFMIDGHAVTVHGSIGLTIHRRGETAAQLLDNADHALYRAKRLGRNRVESFDDEFRAWADQQRDLAELLADDLAVGSLALSRQTLWDLTTGVRLGSLATPSWAHTKSASDLVDIAVRHGLGPTLGRWMTRQAILDAATAGDGGQIIVELPPGLVTQPAFVTWIEDALTSSGTEADRLVVAITEAELADTEAVEPVLEALDRLGVSVALSGFGSDTASLALFGSLLVDQVLIAPELIAGIATDGPRRAVVESLLRIAEAIGQRVVATGPEDLEDVQTLVDLGCEAVVTDLDLHGVARPAGVDLPDLVSSQPLVLR
jgi:diguanylate cyclase (GGDEF)-like protein